MRSTEVGPRSCLHNSNRSVCCRVIWILRCPNDPLWDQSAGFAGAAGGRWRVVLGANQEPPTRDLSVRGSHLDVIHVECSKSARTYVVPNPGLPIRGRRVQAPRATVLRRTSHRPVPRPSRSAPPLRALDRLLPPNHWAASVEEDAQRGQTSEGGQRVVLLFQVGRGGHVAIKNASSHLTFLAVTFLAVTFLGSSVPAGSSTSFINLRRRCIL